MKGMKALRYHAFGGVEQLVIDDIPMPEPAADEILVKVSGSGVNPLDWKLMGGMMPNLPLPKTTGSEFSGVIEKMGSEVKGYDIGDEVYGSATYGLAGGTAAEYFVAKVGTFSKKPGLLDLADAAGVPIAGLTAWQALFEKGNVQSGQRVLIHAGAGGVGSVAIQLARWKGAHVIATGSASSQHFIEELGADEFIDYKTTKFEDVVKDVDMVFGTIPGETLEKSHLVLKKGGVVVTIVGMPSNVAEYEAEGKKVVELYMQPSESQLVELAGLVDGDLVRLVVSTMLPLERGKEAYVESMGGHARGKIILKVS